MALPTLNLDDRTFDQLFAFMRKQIDTGEWLDHNLSDPGIAQLDLLCWIGEMILYRANRVPDSHIEKFADLIMDPPEAVTVPVRLTATHNAEVVLPAGTRFATDFVAATSTRPARRFVFETIAPLRFRALATPPPHVQTLTVIARELMVVTKETLGTSTGLPNQTFPLRPVHTDLGLPLDRPAPILTDFVHRSATYDPNPLVDVGGAPWTLKRFLLTDDSRLAPGPLPPPKKHYMVDPRGAIRFGDDVFGSIPAAGALIECTRYQVLQGPDALIPADRLVHLLNPVAGLTVNAIANGAAEGGDFFFRPEERIREGLKRFRRPYRLITSSDFEQVLRFDFNEFQARAQAPERVFRAIAVMNRKPTAPADVKPGHVTITVLAGKPSRGHIAFSGQPAAASTITLNGSIWTFVGGSPAANQTRLEANLDATLVALATDLNASADSQVAKCTYTANTAADRLEIQFDAADPAGDGFTLAASPTSSGTVSGPALTGGDLDAALTDPALPEVQKQALISLTPGLVDKIGRFLDRRRLITTRLYLQAPALTFMSIAAHVVVARDRSTTEMAALIERRLRGFLGITRGGFDQKGWPLGGSVYRSKLFRLLEDIDGVDHVETLILTPADLHGDVAVAPLSLPAVAVGGLSVTVTRV